MAEGEADFDALREAIDEFGRERAPEVVAEARAEAVAKARSILSDAIAQSLLDHAGPHLAGSPSPRTVRREPSPPRREAQETERKPAAPAEADGYYVYGVISAADPDLPTDVPGVDPRHPATLIEHNGLAAIVSRVSLAEFGEEQLHENLNDVAWLEEKARSHERVLDEALSRMTVVPMRLCTIYRSRQQVETMLGSEHTVFVDALESLEGKAEWGVKLIAEPGALERAAAPRGDPGAEDAGELSPGMAYLRGRSEEAETREELDRIAMEWADGVHQRLASRVSEALLNPLQNPEVSGHEGEMLLNGVYLVGEDEAPAFHRAVEELQTEYRERGADVELTGPWPPYNFVKGSIEAAR